MALFRTRSAAIYGIDAHLIDVEVDMYPGAGRDFITVGMPDTAVRESRERIKSAHAQLRVRISQQDRDHQPGAGQRAQGRARGSICPWPWASWAPWEW